METIYYKTQDPKYEIALTDGEPPRLVNSITKKPIPDDEPLFILRGQDWHVPATIADYEGRANIWSHKQAVRERLTDFVIFQANNPNRIKEPNT